MMKRMFAIGRTIIISMNSNILYVLYHRLLFRGSGASKEIVDCILEVGEGDRSDVFGINNKNTIQVRFEIRKSESNGFIDATTNTIATNSTLENFFRNHHAKSLVIASVDSKNKGNLSATNSRAISIGVFDTTARMETIF